MIRKSGRVRNENRTLQSKYDLTALFYDFLDYYWERQYRQWRPMLTRDVCGIALEAGVAVAPTSPGTPAPEIGAGFHLGRSFQGGPGFIGCFRGRAKRVLVRIQQRSLLLSGAVKI